MTIKIEAALRLKAFNEGADEERIKHVQMDIQHLEEDVKDGEEDGEDMTQERKQLDDRRAELRKLKGLD